MNPNQGLTIDQRARLKTIHIRKKFSPWLGPELNQLIDRCNATRRRYKLTGNATLLGEFLPLSSEVDIRPPA